MSKSNRRDQWRGSQSPLTAWLTWLALKRVKLAWGTMLTAALGLFIWFIALLLYAPKRTPLVVISSTDYKWPLPPNAWAASDIEKQQRLDGKSIELRGEDSRVKNKADFWERIAVEVASDPGPRDGLPLVLWINMHAVADAGSGTLQLIPSGASPFDSSSWIDFRELLQQVQQLATERETLLILDGQRMQVNWHIGLRANQVSERIQELLAQVASPRLAVMLAAGSDQHAAVSSNLQGSAFGHFLQQGLAGAADRDPRNANQDGWVSLRELQQYVSQHVQRWSLANRGISQTPRLVTADEELDFRITRNLDSQALEELLSGNRSLPRLAPNITAAQLDALWQELDLLREFNLYQAEPIAWRDLEHRLLWLEQLATAGPSYQVKARGILEQTELQLEGIRTRLADARTAPSLPASRTILSGNALSLPQLTTLHSLPLDELLAVVSASDTAEARSIFAAFEDAPSPQQLQIAQSQLDGGRAAVSEAAQFLVMLDRYQFPALWDSASKASELLQLQMQIRDLAVPSVGPALSDTVRVHAWTRGLLAATNVLRRQTEDIFFVHGQPDLAQLIETVRSDHERTVQATTSVSQALLACDQVLAQTAYLAAWLSDPRNGKSADSKKRIVEQTLLPLIQNTATLGERLTSQIPNDSATAPFQDLESLCREVDERIQQPLQVILSDLEGQCRSLLAASQGGNPRTVTELEGLLHVPLLSWKYRADLRSARELLASRLHSEYLEDLTSEPELTQTASEQATPKLVQQIEDWSQHPLSAILHITQQEGPVSPSQILSNYVEAQWSELDQVDSVYSQRQLASRAELRLRATAPIAFAVPQQNPVTTLLSLDLQSLLLWHAQSKLNDFWGKAGRTQAFFEPATASCLGAAQAISQGKNLGQIAFGELQEPIRLRNRLAAQQALAASWLATRASAKIQLDPDDEVTVEVSVRESDVQDASQLEFSLPSGTAAIFVTDSLQQRLSETNYQPAASVDLPLEEFDSSLTLESRASAGSDFRARTMFRGHEYDDVFFVEQLQGIRMVVTPDATRQSEVSLHSPWDSLSVAFVLDCSHSMGEPLSSSGEDMASRLEVAKQSLQELMIRLSSRPKVRIGLHLFGHRLGWSTDKPLRAMAQPDFDGIISPDLTPSQDVEAVYPLQAFDTQAARRVIPRISAAQPWGQSPLYLAVLRALQEFGTGVPESERHLIVITDGANYQFTPSNGSAVQATRMAEVRQAALERGIPVHVLGLNMDRQRDQSAIQEFDQLCRQTGGNFQTLTNATDLQAALRALLEPGIYRLGESPELAELDRQAILGQSVQLRVSSSEPQQFWLTYEGQELVDPDATDAGEIPFAQEPIWLEGGETIPLYVDAEGQSIYAYPFDNNLVAEEPLLDARGGSTTHVIRIHEPQVREQSVVIPVSWQRWDAFAGRASDLWRVTKRPASVWIEVQPLASDGSPVGLAYAFHETNYISDQPVPLLRLLAGNWPVTSDLARIRVWCLPAVDNRLELPPQDDFELPAPKPTLPVPTPAAATSARLTLSGYRPQSESPSTIVIRESSEGSQSLNDGLQLRTERQIVSTGEGACLRFILDYTETDAAVGAHKITLPEDGPVSAYRIVRQFDAQHRLAVHSYFFEQLPENWPPQISISTRESEFADAWRMANEVTVEVAPRGGLLPVLSSPAR